MTRFNPRIGTSIVGVYKLTSKELNAFIRDLWMTDTIESIRSTFIGDGSNAILGLQWFYGLDEDMPVYDNKSYINVGNVVFKQLSKVPVLKREFAVHSFGAIDPNVKSDDYTSYVGTSYKAYLPFVGVIDLDPRDVAGKSLWLSYVVNVTDGSAVCELRNGTADTKGTAMIFSAPCQWGYDIPLKVNPSRDAVTATLRVVTGGVIGGDGPSYTAGGLTPNMGVMSDLVPKLYIYRRDVVAGDINTAIGRPSSIDIKVGEATGYLKARAVYGGSKLPARHVGEITQMLMDGVYL